MVKWIECVCKINKKEQTILEFKWLKTKNTKVKKCLVGISKIYINEARNRIATILNIFAKEVVSESKNSVPEKKNVVVGWGRSENYSKSEKTI